VKGISGTISGTLISVKLRTALEMIWSLPPYAKSRIGLRQFQKIRENLRKFVSHFLRKFQKMRSLFETEIKNGTIFSKKFKKFKKIRNFFVQFSPIWRRSPLHCRCLHPFWPSTSSNDPSVVRSPWGQWCYFEQCCCRGDAANEFQLYRQMFLRTIDFQLYLQMFLLERPAVFPALCAGNHP
jgi:hypothetical protein